MVKKLAAAAVFSVAMISGVALSQASDFTAAPLNSGPPKAPGIPVVDEVLGVGNAVTSPVLQPILAPGGGAAAPVAGSVHHRRHHRHHHHA